jgi:uncharacterized protein YrzB (UPF0473 family)
MPKKYRPKLPKDSVWRELVDLVREVGVERAYQTLTKQDDFKTEFNSNLIVFCASTDKKVS